MSDKPEARAFPLRFRNAHAAPRAAFIAAALAITIPSQRQFDELRSGGLPADSHVTHVVAVGDVDVDGDLDMILGNGGFPGGSGQNRLYLNDGNGNFTDATPGRFPADSDDTRFVALGDVDRDGDLDVVLANARFFGPVERNRRYLNDGTGDFTDVTDTRMPADTDFTFALALGDVDHDGDLDLVTGNSNAQNRLYLNNGTGTFTDATATHMPLDKDRTGVVILADVDRDGDLDLAVGNRNAQDRLLLNDGEGRYSDATAERMPIDRDDTTALAAGDVDRDGDLDLILGGSRGRHRLYLNDGAGTYIDATGGRLPPGDESSFSIAAGDLDRDGDLDLVYAGLSRVLLNDGAGTFADATQTSLPPVTEFSSSVALADMDRDGDLDLALGNGSGENRLYLNDGAGTYSSATEVSMPPESGETHGIALGDVEGDGDLDMLLANRGQNSLYLNDGTGSYSDATRDRLPAVSDDTSGVAAADVDGDGDLDVVYGTSAGGQNRLYLNDGTGVYTDVTLDQLPADSDSTAVVVLGDVDRDSDLDIVCGNTGTRQNRLYLNDGTGIFTDVTQERLPADSDGTLDVELGDIDSDGDLDLVFANSVGQNRLYLNDGAGTFVDATAERLPADDDATAAVALGDVEGDGDLDILFGNRGQNRLYLNDGAGAYTDATPAQMPVLDDLTRASALGDLDGDGDLDAVFGDANGLGEQNRFYLNDGGGHFTDSTAARFPSDRDRTVAVTLGDADGDGDPDIVFGNRGQDRLYLNLLRQLHTPLVAKPGREFRLDAYARYGPPRPGDLAFLYLSTGRGSVPLPPIGTIGIDLSRAAGFPLLLVPQPEGLGSVSFAVPDDPNLLGVSVFGQALLAPFGGGPWALTNVTADQVVR